MIIKENDYRSVITSDSPRKMVSILINADMTVDEIYGDVDDIFETELNLKGKNINELSKINNSFIIRTDFVNSVIDVLDKKKVIEKSVQVNERYFTERFSYYKQSEVERIFVSIIDSASEKFLENQLYTNNAMLKNVVEATTAGYWHLNMETGEVFLSAQYKQMFGYEDHEVGNDPNWWENFVDTEHVEQAKIAFGHLINSNGVIPYDVVVPAKHRDGSKIWINCRAEIYSRDENGNPTKFVGSHINITRLKQAEEELKNVLYIATHDIKTPFDNIRGFLELIKKNLSKETQEKAINQIEYSLDNGREIIENLMKIAHNQVDSSKFQDTIDVRQCVAGAINNLSSLIENKQAAITVDCSSLPELVYSSFHLCSMLTNLIKNSINYSMAGRPPEIKILSKKHEVYNVIQVSDNGQGIDLEKNGAKIFSLFERINDDVNGSGMALYLIKQTIEKTGGKITVESTLNEGTTFTLWLTKNTIA